MFKAHGFYGNDYTKHSTYQGLVDEFIQLDCEKEELGVGSDGELHLYGLKYGDTENKPVIFIDANCHGSEWQASHFTLDFLNRIINRDYPNKPLVDAIADTFAFYIIPSTNPWGYENSKYTNFNGVNLNRNMDHRGKWESAPTGEETVNYKGSAPFSEEESKIVRDKFNSLKPFVGINVHTTTGAKSGIDTDRGYRVYRPLLLDAYRSCDISVAKHLTGSQEWSVAGSPTFSGFYGSKMSKEGLPCIPTILEAQADQNLFNYGLTSLFVLAIYAYHFYKTGVSQIVDIEDVMRIVESESE